MSRKLLWGILCLLLILSSVVPPTHAHSASEEEEDDDHTSHTEEGANLRRKSLVLVKVWCLIIIFFATFLPGVSPYFFRWNHSFLVLGTQFAGGVFLGTALMHFLSDANETFEARSDKEYPFAFMLASAGYLLTMLGDSIIQWIFIKQVPAGRVDTEKGTAMRPRGVAIHTDYKCECCDQNVNSCQCRADEDGSVDAKTFVKATLVKSASFADTLLLILALCFHSVFEGIAIGVAETSNDAWKALWTISLHKVFAAIAMGIALLRMVPDRPLLSCALYAFAFAISSPVGVAIGIIIDATTEGAVADWIFAITMGLACGVFVYVAINHLLAKGYTPDSRVVVDTPFYKFLAVTLGVGVIAVVMIWDA